MSVKMEEQEFFANDAKKINVQFNTERSRLTLHYMKIPKNATKSENLP